MTANEALKQVEAGYQDWWTATIDGDDEDGRGIGSVCIRHQGFCASTGVNTWVDYEGGEYLQEELAAFHPVGWLPVSTLPHRAKQILIARHDGQRLTYSVESWNCVYQQWMLCSGVGRSEQTIRGWKPL